MGSAQMVDRAGRNARINASLSTPCAPFPPSVLFFVDSSMSLDVAETIKSLHRLQVVTVCRLDAMSRC